MADPEQKSTGVVVDCEREAERCTDDCLKAWLLQDPDVILNEATGAFETSMQERRPELLSRLRDIVKISGVDSDREVSDITDIFNSMLMVSIAEKAIQKTYVVFRVNRTMGCFHCLHEGIRHNMILYDRGRFISLVEWDEDVISRFVSREGCFLCTESVALICTVCGYSYCENHKYHPCDHIRDLKGRLILPDEGYVKNSGLVKDEDIPLKEKAVASATCKTTKAVKEESNDSTTKEESNDSNAEQGQAV